MQGRGSRLRSRQKQRLQIRQELVRDLGELLVPGVGDGVGVALGERTRARVGLAQDFLLGRDPDGRGIHVELQREERRPGPAVREIGAELVGVDLDLERDKDTWRDVEL